MARQTPPNSPAAHQAGIEKDAPSLATRPAQGRSTGRQTQAIHGGEQPDPVTGASAPSLTMSSTFVVNQVEGFSAHDMSDDPHRHVYARWGNPNVASLEAKIAGMEGVEACLCFASGMAAATGMFLTFLSAGDHCIISDVCYAGVAELARETLPRFGIEVSLVNLSDLDAVDAALRPNTRLIHAESPCNPIMRLCDLRALADRIHACGGLLSCDATFASPLGQDSAELGVDLILHSITKYIGGHGDALGGAIAGSRALIDRLRMEAAIHHGGILSPFNAWLIGRGAATLPLRMEAHQRGAMAVAQALEAHPSVTKVLYPGLASHPQHALAQRQMQNFSGMMAFQVADAATGKALAERMIERMSIVHYAVSLGHHRSLIFWMPTQTLMDSSFHLEGANLAAYRDFAGDGVFRLSVGLEDPEDIIADLDAALSA